MENHNLVKHLAVALLLACATPMASQKAAPTDAIKTGKASRSATDRLWAALQEGDGHEALRLAESGAKAPGVNQQGSTALMLLAQLGYWADHTPLAGDAQVRLAECLLKGGASLKAVAPTGRTALMMASRAGKLSLVKWILAHSRSHLETRDEDGAWPLFHAAVEAHLDIVQALLASGAQPDGVNPQGMSPLLAAAGHPGIVHSLLEAGADPGRRGENGLGLVERAIYGGASLEEADAYAKLIPGFEPHPSLLALMAYRRQAAKVRALLARHWGDPNARLERGGTALGYAAEQGDLELVEDLLKAGANVVQKTDSWGRTPLSGALASRAFRVAERLMEDPRYQQVVEPKRSAVKVAYLALACGDLPDDAPPGERQAQERVIRRLIEWGVSPDQTDLENTSARKLAEDQEWLQALLPKRDPILEEACWWKRSSEAELPPDEAFLPPPIRLHKGAFHPKNRDRLPEVGRGKHGYVFQLAPRTRYRLFARGVSISGVPEGILFDVTDDLGYTKFVRMPKAVPRSKWHLSPIVGPGGFGAGDGHFGEAFSLQYEKGGAMRGNTYAVVSEDGEAYLGRTSENGETFYVTTMTPQNLHVYLNPGLYDGEESTEPLAKAAIYFKQKGPAEAVLQRFEGLFRAVSRQNPERFAKSPRCFLRAVKTAFAFKTGQAGKATEDLDHLKRCPSLPEASASYLFHIAEALRERPESEADARLFEDKAKALDPSREESSSEEQP